MSPFGTFAEPALQVFIIVMAFQADSGVRHVEQMKYAFTSIEKCEEYARGTMLKYHKRIKGLYWYCTEVTVDP